MRGIERLAILCAAALFLAAPGFADDKNPRSSDKSATPAANTSATDSSAKPTDDSTAQPSASSASSAVEPEPAAAPLAAAASPATAVPVPPPQGSDETDYSEPRFIPMPAVDGNPGLFTLETGETLPKHGISAAVALNKFSRMPGDITSLQLVPSAAYGVTNWFSLFFDMDAMDHLHVGTPSQLSLAPVNAANPQYLNTIYPSVIPSTGFPPAYVEDFPFASHSGQGTGEIDLGFKLGLLSERRGKPLSLSIRNDFFVPTKTGLTALLNNQVQYGKFNYGIGVEASKTIMHRSMTATVNWAYRFTRNSSFNTSIGGTPETVVLNLADQMQVGGGFVVFPDKRFQIMTEYDATIYIGKGIQNTSFGARDPVDNITGIRIYAFKGAAMDLGYRYSLDLTNHRDRNGFVIKLAAASWPGKPLPPDSLTSSCSVDKTSVIEGSGEYVSATVRATDRNGRPLTYVWTASGGKISGIGPYVRWDYAGLAPGSYMLTSRVDDGAGQTSSCSATVAVQAR
ncbi:MAG: hypothetical protein WCC18_03245 [Candidatus Acidiferrales bacterium]